MIQKNLSGSTNRKRKRKKNGVSSNLGMFQKRDIFENKINLVLKPKFKD